MMVVDQCVRLGMAIVIIALVSLALYQFSNRASASASFAAPVAHIAPAAPVAPGIMAVSAGR